MSTSLYSTRQQDSVTSPTAPSASLLVVLLLGTGERLGAFFQRTQSMDISLVQALKKAGSTGKTSTHGSRTNCYLTVHYSPAPALLLYLIMLRIIAILASKSLFEAVDVRSVTCLPTRLITIPSS